MSSHPAHRRIKVERIGNVAVVNFVDKRIIEDDYIMELGDDLYRLVDELGWRKVLLNFGSIEYWSSAALGKVVTLHRKLQLVEGRLVLCGVTPTIMEVFNITRLDKILTITADPDLADLDAATRDMFGNPFRPVAFSPEWRTDTAVALARQMYESREFSAMPILADALQDADCNNEDILSHCRSEGPHVRGCWVVDLVLGKE